MARAGKHTTANAHARANANAMPEQISKSASAYQSYGQPTAYSQAYSQWADKAPQREFDMTAGKRAARRRVVLVVLALLVIAAVIAFFVLRPL